MEIRYITADDDRYAISRIFEESWKYAYKGIVPKDYLDSIREGRWARNMDIPGWDTIVCVEDGELAGTCTISKSRLAEYPDSGEVISIYFLPEYMGRGYGKALLDFALAELQKQGYPDVYLWVLEENSRARRFYEKYGFTCTGDITSGKIGGKELREVRYSLKFQR